MSRSGGIILIGPVCTGKSTLGQLLAQSHNRPWINLDSIADQYYEESGFSMADFQKMSEEQGFLAAYRKGGPSLAYAAERVLVDYKDCIIAFGAGHSHYEDERLLRRVEQALAPFPNVVLILPSPDLDRSVAVLRERSLQQRKWDWRVEGYDFLARWVKDEANHRLATVTVYTEGKTPEQTRDEILHRVNG